MPFTFPDPQVTPEFTADNGITYAWDADDSKWQVRGFKASTGVGEVIQVHGPWQYKAAGSAISPGEWTVDEAQPRKVKQITFHNKDANGKNVDWSDLQTGEIISIFQSGDFSAANGPTDGWSMINYEVMSYQIFSQATVIDVNCHWTYIVFSTGQVQYNPNELFGFLTGTDTYAIESQPATLNNVAHTAKKASVAPAFYSFRLHPNTSEPALGINPGQMVFSAGADIQNPNSIIIAGNDEYGNGIQSGSNTITCPGSIVKLFRKNLDGSICLCRIYNFDKFVSYGNGTKVRFTELTLAYKATNGTPTIPDPGTMQPGAQYLLSYEFGFIKGYIDNKFPTWTWKSAKQSGSNYAEENILWTYIDTDTIKLNISQVPKNGQEWRYPGKEHTAVSFPINIQGTAANGKLVPVLCGTTSSIRSLDFNGSPYWQVYVPASNQFIWTPNAVPDMTQITLTIPGYFS